MIDLKSLDPNEIEKVLKEVPKFIDMIKSKLPMIDNLEKAWRLENKLNDDDIFIYSFMKNEANTKIMLYIFSGTTLKEELKGNNVTVKKGTLIIDKKIKSFDLFEVAEKISKDGVNGLIDLLVL